MKISGDWVSGFVDGEGCFSLFIREDRKRERKGSPIYRYWVVDFAITLREDDIGVLRKFQEYFKCGIISHIGTKEDRKRKLRDNTVLLTVHYQVRNIRDINEYIIPHFEKFPLQSKKALEYERWKKAVLILNRARSRKEKTFQRLPLTEEENGELELIRKTLSKRLTGGHLRRSEVASLRKIGKDFTEIN